METASSKEGQQKHTDHWEPEWTVERFVAIALCNNCEEPVTMAGETEVVPDYDDDGHPSSWKSELNPLFVRPAPNIVHRPRQLPTKLKQPLTKAEELFRSDFGASGNAIRTIIEEILTDRGIKQSTLNKKKKKRSRLDLHSRIAEFRKKNGDLADKMLAVKWLGNAGSHAGEGLTRDDLFDGFDLLQHILDELYGKRTARLNKLARQITKAKGPRSKMRRRRTT